MALAGDESVAAETHLQDAVKYCAESDKPHGATAARILARALAAAGDETGALAVLDVVAGNLGEVCIEIEYERSRLGGEPARSLGPEARNHFFDLEPGVQSWVLSIDPVTRVLADAANADTRVLPSEEWNGQRFVSARLAHQAERAMPPRAPDTLAETHEYRQRKEAYKASRGARGESPTPTGWPAKLDFSTPLNWFKSNYAGGLFAPATHNWRASWEQSWQRRINAERLPQPG